MKKPKKTTEIAYCYYSLVIVVDSQIKTPTFWRQICYVPFCLYFLSFSSHHNHRTRSAHHTQQLTNFLISKIASRQNKRQKSK